MLASGADGDDESKTAIASHTEAGGTETDALGGTDSRGGSRRTRSVKKATSEMAALAGRGSVRGGSDADTSKTVDAVAVDVRSSVIFVSDSTKTDTDVSVLR